MSERRNAQWNNAVLRAPAVRALIIQVAAFTVTVVLLYGIARLTDTRATLLVAALLQGGIAALISHRRRLALWWLPIQFLFPAAVIAMLSLNLPPVLFLVAFIFLLTLYWTTFRTQVPFYPSGPAIREAISTLLPIDHPIQFVDVGSGLGGLILDLAKRRPESTFVGIEIAPLPWLISFLRAVIARNKARFIRDDYCNHDLGCYAVVFAYLSPAAMPALWEKASAEMQPGSLLLSYEFPIPAEKSHIMMMPVVNGPALFGWRM